METIGTAQHLYEQRNQLVKSQIQKIANLAVEGVVKLPVADDTVKAYVDTNFSFYHGTLTRRSHNAAHSLAGPLDYEVVHHEYTRAIQHIGYMVNRGALLFDAEVIDLYQLVETNSTDTNALIAA